MAKGDTPDVPDWVPSWAPSQATVAYVSTGLTAMLLAGVTIYLAWHLLTGGRPGLAATTAAGVGVGGAGT
jgi:putative flippase GtrA